MKAHSTDKLCQSVLMEKPIINLTEPQIQYLTSFVKEECQQTMEVTIK